MILSGISTEPESFLFPNLDNIAISSEILWIYFQLVLKISEVLMALLDAWGENFLIRVHIVILLLLNQISILEKLDLLPESVRWSSRPFAVIRASYRFEEDVLFSINWHSNFSGPVVLNEFQVLIWPDHFLFVIGNWVLLNRWWSWLLMKLG